MSGNGSVQGAKSSGGFSLKVKGKMLLAFTIVILFTFVIAGSAIYVLLGSKKIAENANYTLMTEYKVEEKAKDDLAKCLRADNQPPAISTQPLEPSPSKFSYSTTPKAAF